MCVVGSGSRGWSPSSSSVRTPAMPPHSGPSYLLAEVIVDVLVGAEARLLEVDGQRPVCVQRPGGPDEVRAHRQRLLRNEGKGHEERMSRSPLDFGGGLHDGSY